MFHTRYSAVMYTGASDDIPCHVFVGQGDGILSHNSLSSGRVSSNKNTLIVLQTKYGLLLKSIQLKLPLQTQNRYKGYRYSKFYTSQSNQKNGTFHFLSTALWTVATSGTGLVRILFQRSRQNFETLGYKLQRCRQQKTGVKGVRICPP